MQPRRQHPRVNPEASQVLTYLTVLTSAQSDEIHLPIVIPSSVLYDYLTMHKRHTPGHGFTIIELLIVIVVVAILATISIVAYRGIQDRARASEVAAGLIQAKKKLELYKVDNGSYPTTGNLSAADVKDSDVAYQYTSEGSTYCITGTVGTTSYKATNTGNPEQGGCAGHGQGGVAAITNLAKSPRGASASYISSNDSTVWEVTRNITVPATPDGITSAAQSRLVGSSPYILSMFDIDGLGNTGGITRSFSAWVRVNASGYSLMNNTSYWTVQSLPANTWARVQTIVPFPGTSWSIIYIRKDSGIPAASDRAWITGIMSVEGTQHYAFADGNSPNWIWNGTPNSSSSTGPAF